VSVNREFTVQCHNAIEQMLTYKGTVARTVRHM